MVAKSPKYTPTRAVPLTITAMRAVFAALFLIVFLSLEHINLAPLRVTGIVVMWLLFTLIGVSDLLDGIIARKYKLISDAGKVLDPLADVFSHITYFVCLVHGDILWTWLCMVIIYRELIIIAARMLLALRGVPFPAGKGGKLKTVLFTAATVGGLIVFSARLLDIFPTATRNGLHITTTVLFLAATAMSYGSLIKYLVQIHQEKLLTAKPGASASHDSGQ